MTEEELQQLIDDYKKTNWPALLREDMGKYHLKELKSDLDSIKRVLNNIVNHSHLKELIQSGICQSHLQAILQEFHGLKNDIINYTDNKANKDIINRVIQFKNYIPINHKELFNVLEFHDKYYSDIMLDKSIVRDKKNVLSYKELDKEKQKYQSASKETEKELQKLQQIRSQYAEQIARKEVSRYGDFFKDEAENNKKLSWWFGGGLLLFSTLACILSYCLLAVDTNIKVDNIYELIIKGNLIGKVFIFTVFIIIISVIQRTYLAQSHQYTLNKHRHNALNSHKEILNSIQKTEIKSDKEIANAILLELTKSMFTPQDTGFVKGQKDISSSNKVVEISKSLFNTSQE